MGINFCIPRGVTAEFAYMSCLDKGKRYMSKHVSQHVLTIVFNKAVCIFTGARLTELKPKLPIGFNLTSLAHTTGSVTCLHEIVKTYWLIQ